jgi:shikimate kinase
MKNLVLMGFTGSGKTTVGKWVADRLGMVFVDMDAVIEQQQGKTPMEIFESLGEPSFRQMERQLVAELASKEGQVIATGGGAALDKTNVEDFRRTGVVICLDVAASAAHQRTKAKADRPLLHGPNRWLRLRRLYRERAPVYAALPFHVDTTDKGLEAIADAVIHIYKQHGGGT